MSGNNYANIIRADKNGNFTVMSNYHLRDKRLSLKAVGLLSKMLSCSDDWVFSTAGLAHYIKKALLLSVLH